MKLGSDVEVYLTIEDIELGVNFYEQLGFQVIPAPRSNHPVESLSDGSVIITLFQSVPQAPTLKYHSSPTAYLLPKIQDLSIGIEDQATHTLEFMIGEGTNFVCSERPTLARDLTESLHISSLGRFGEFTLYTPTPTKTLYQLNQLGFSQLYEDQVRGWSIYTDQEISLRIHQYDLIPALSLTFYSSDIHAIASKIALSALPLDNDSIYINAPGNISLILIDSNRIY